MLGKTPLLPNAKDIIYTMVSNKHQETASKHSMKKTTLLKLSSNVSNINMEDVVDS